MSALFSTQTLKRAISALIDDLPPETLKMVEQFVLFLRQNPPLATQSQYPTVFAPASSLDIWTRLMPNGYSGDALADAEAVYDNI